MIREHTAAVVSLLSGLSVYVSRPPADAAVPYVVVHPDPGTPRVGSLGGVSSWRRWRFQTTCVNTSVDGVQDLADAVSESLLDARPVVAGRSCGLVRVESSPPIQVDESLPVPVFESHTVWSFVSVPA